MDYGSALVAVAAPVLMWKLLFQSVRGSAHERSGQPCQDSCLAKAGCRHVGLELLVRCKSFRNHH